MSVQHEQIIHWIHLSILISTNYGYETLREIFNKRAQIRYQENADLKAKRTLNSSYHSTSNHKGNMRFYYLPIVCLSCIY